jgi:hypothetical protein
MKASLLALVLAAATVAPAFAQAPPRQGRAARGERIAPLEVLRVLDGYAVVQAQEALQLTDAQYGTFVTRLRRLQDTRRQHQQTRSKILGELRRLVGPAAAEGASEAAIRDRLAELRTHDEKAAAELRQAHDAIDEVLDPVQQARFRLFEEQLERRKLDLIMRARQGAAAGGGS